MKRKAHTAFACNVCSHGVAPACFMSDADLARHKRSASHLQHQRVALALQKNKSAAAAPSPAADGSHAPLQEEATDLIPGRPSLTPVEAALLPALIKTSSGVIDTLLRSLHEALGPTLLRWSCLKDFKQKFMGCDGTEWERINISARAKHPVHFVIRRRPLHVLRELLLLAKEHVFTPQQWELEGVKACTDPLASSNRMADNL